jgi:hypothetical protein
MTMQLSLAEDSVRMTDNSRQLQAERVEAIRFTSPASEAICSLCSGTGWRQAGNNYLSWWMRCIATSTSPIKSSCQIKNSSPYRWTRFFRQGVRGLHPRSNYAISSQTGLRAPWRSNGTIPPMICRLIVFALAHPLFMTTNEESDDR